jgi:uncharacterized integral membrane protein
MSLLHGARPESNSQPVSAPPDADTFASAETVTQPTTPQAMSPGRVPRTRTGAAWTALIAVALITVLLIVFLVQNTRSTEISFLWMTTRTPLAVALLIAAVGSVLLTLTIGTVRITQLRRLIRKNRN